MLRTRRCPGRKVRRLMEAKRPARAARMAAPKSLRGKSSLRPNAAPGSWLMVAKTAAGSVERWPLPPACPWAAAPEHRARSYFVRRPMVVGKVDGAGQIPKTCSTEERGDGK